MKMSQPAAQRNLFPDQPSEHEVLLHRSLLALNRIAHDPGVAQLQSDIRAALNLPPSRPAKPLPVGPYPSARRFVPTEEQRLIVDTARKNGRLKILAGAGTGKTSTLELMGRELGGRRLFLVYNKDAQRDAARRFSSNVTVLTPHALAYRNGGHAFASKIRTRLWPDDAYELSEMPASHLQTQYGRMLMAAVQNFCLSTDERLAEKHFEDDDLPEFIVEGARTLWDKMANPKHPAPATHDVYLKLWAMAGPRLPYDGILYDEAQDAWPAVAEAVASSNVPVIYVGDIYQQIYSFRGAIDALDQIALPELHLTQSWRFGEAIADLANRILAWRPSVHAEAPRFKLRGRQDVESAVIAYEFPAFTEERIGSRAIICRSNAALFECAVTAATQKTPLFIVGDPQEIFNIALAALELWKTGKTDHPDLRRFKSWDHFVASSAHDHRLKILTKLIKQYGETIPRLIESIKACLVPDERQAHLVLSSIHRAKGREWDEVLVYNDLPDIVQLQEMAATAARKNQPDKLRQCVEELNLTYVAGTRARRRAYLPETLLPNSEAHHAAPSL